MTSKNTHTSLLREVLKPRPALQLDVPVPAIKIEPGSGADAVVDKAASQVRLTLCRYTRPIDAKKEPDAYQAGCFDTAFGAAFDAEQTLARHGALLEAAAVRYIFVRALEGMRVYPTTLRAQVEAQMCAIAAGQAIRLLMSKQAALAL